MNEDENQAIRDNIDRMREENRDLYTAIEALTRAGPVDQLQLQRLKKRKLALRDRVQALEDESTPDIIA